MMDREDPASILRQAVTGQEYGSPACPDEHQIAAYMDGRLDSRDVEALEQHLADCEACTGLVGLLSRVRESEALEPVPDLVLARVRRLGAHATRSRKEVFPRLAAAALVLVSISALVHFGLFQPPAPEAPTSAALRATRSAPPSSQPLQVLSPTADATVDANAWVVHWTELPGTRYYVVRIVTDTGELVGEHRVSETQWQPKAAVALQPGMHYFVRVDAYQSETKTVSSSHVPFTVAKRP